MELGDDLEKGGALAGIFRPAGLGHELEGRRSWEGRPQLLLAHGVDAGLGVDLQLVAFHLIDARRHWERRQDPGLQEGLSPNRVLHLGTRELLRDSGAIGRLVVLLERKEAPDRVIR